jgi:hypothetical protein
MFPEMSNFLSPPAKPGDYLCIYERGSNGEYQMIPLDVAAL